MATLYMRWVLVAFVAAGQITFAEQANAILVPAVDAGFVTEAGGSAKGDGAVPIAASATYNYSVGRELHYSSGFYSASLTPMLKNNYFVFDLAGIAPGSIVGASLKLNAGTYESIDTSESYVIGAPTDPGMALGDAMFLKGANAVGMTEFDAPTDPAIGVATGLYGNIASSPMIFGGAMISALDDDTELTISLSAGGVGYLNAFAGGKAFLGGKVLSAPPPLFPQQPFGLTGPDIPGGDPLTPMLLLTVIPESRGAMCTGVGLMMIGLIGIRRSER